MADSGPVQSAPKALKRDEKGRLLPGTGAGPGRPKLPDWFTDKAPSALAMVVAAATGEVAEGFEDNPAIVEMAATCPQNLRILAADKMADRTFGKAREHIEHSGEVAEVRRVELAIVRVETKPLAPASKTLTLDAE